MSNYCSFDELWDYSNPSETLKKFRQLESDLAAKTNQSCYLQLLTQVARCYSLQNQFNEAHSQLENVKTLLSPDYKVAKIRYFLELGRSFNSAGEKHKAVLAFKQAVEIAEPEQEDFHLADAFHMLGIADDPKQQLFWNQKALTVLDSTKDAKAKKWAASLNNNIGWFYFEQQQPKKALIHFESALQHRIAQENPQAIFIAKWCVAKAQRTLGNTTEALKALLELEQEMDSGQIESDGFVYEELAECYVILGQSDKYKKYFKLAFDLFSKDKWLVENEQDRLARIQQLSQ